MKGYLNQIQIDYVFFHLNLVFQITDEIKSKCIFSTDNHIEPIAGKIIFKLSKDPLKFNNIKEIKGLPVLFPCNTSEELWTLQNNNLVFEHDLLKSSFYLLSGYQEYENPVRDMLGRFSAKDSIQYKLNFLTKPIVNYYFIEIFKAFQDFLLRQGIRIEPKPIFKPFSFLLTHDVDRVKQFSVNYLVYKVKELLGIKKTEASVGIIFRQLLRAIPVFLSGGHKDPGWDFDYLRRVEARHNFVSAFYFLDNETRHIDADYKFSETRMLQLINRLHRDGCEIGLHGNHQSAVKENSLHNALNKLRGVYPFKIRGIRQHRLRYEIPLTARIQENAGFVYDTSLGYYDYEGFRNSFCLPFRLFDFQNNKPFNIWEIPLNVMDCTLLEYRVLNFEEAMLKVKGIINEVTKFSGVFTLLWHNGYFDEVRFPGIHQFYEDMLAEIAQCKPENMLGYQVIDKMNEKK